MKANVRRLTFLMILAATMTLTPAISWARTQGTVVGWGSNIFMFYPGGYYSGQATPPDGLTDVVEIAGGWVYSLALKSDGTVVGWGSNNFYDNYTGQATPPEGLPM